MVRSHWPAVRFLGIPITLLDPQVIQPAVGSELTILKDFFGRTVLHSVVAYLVGIEFDFIVIVILF